MTKEEQEAFECAIFELKEWGEISKRTKARLNVLIVAPWRIEYALWNGYPDEDHE